METFILSGPEDKSGIPHASLGKLFVDFFSSFDKDTLAAIDPSSGESLTYEQLYQRSKNLATSLKLLGVTKNDNIAVLAENSLEFLIVYLAAVFLATPLHLTNPKFTKYELKHILALTEPVVVFCTKKTRHNVIEAVSELDFVKTFICFDWRSEMPLVMNDSFKIEEEINPEDHVALICNSSGTTGLPKAVMITHENVRLYCIYGRDPKIFYMRVGRIVPVVLPFFHTGAVHLINAAFAVGATIIPVDGFEPDFFLKTIQKYKPDNFTLSPSMIHFLADSPIVDNYDLSSVECLYSGGSFFSDEDLRTLWDKLNLKEFHGFYGMSETGIAVQGLDYTLGNRGRVILGRHLKIADLKNGETLPPNNSGEICIKGEIMKGYVKNLEETKKIIDSEGFLHTGDVGHFDQDGYVYITERIKEIIKYKSWQVSPIELEMILIKHASITDVAVVGKPDRRFGEIPVAFVVKKEGATVTEKEICNYLAEFVSEDKRLFGGVRFVQNIPRNSMGKIVRHELVKQLNV